ncbi:hypothetical protein D9M71_761010 [compost metagenome]
MLKQLLSTYRASNRRIRDTQVPPQNLEGVAMLSSFLGVLAVFGDQAFVVADHAAGFFLLNHQRLLEQGHLLLHLVDLSLVAV